MYHCLLIAFTGCLFLRSSLSGKYGSAFSSPRMPSNPFAVRSFEPVSMSRPTFFEVRTSNYERIPSDYSLPTQVFARKNVGLSVGSDNREASLSSARQMDPVLSQSGRRREETLFSKSDDEAKGSQLQEYQRRSNRPPEHIHHVPELRNAHLVSDSHANTAPQSTTEAGTTITFSGLLGNEFEKFRSGPHETDAGVSSRSEIVSVMNENTQRHTQDLTSFNRPNAPLPSVRGPLSKTSPNSKNEVSPTSAISYPLILLASAGVFVVLLVCMYSLLAPRFNNQGVALGDCGDRTKVVQVPCQCKSHHNRPTNEFEMTSSASENTTRSTIISPNSK